MVTTGFQSFAAVTPRVVPCTLFLASAVCKCLQCLISALKQGGKGGHLFRLTCSVVLWGGRSLANKYHWHVYVGSAHSVWTTLGLPQLTVCVLSQSTLLRFKVALQGNCPKWPLGFVHFPGLSCSGSGSWVFHKGTESVGHAFCVLPRSEQLRQPGAWQVHCPRWSVHLITSQVPAAHFLGCTARVPSQMCCVSPLGC